MPEHLVDMGTWITALLCQVVIGHARAVIWSKSHYRAFSPDGLATAADVVLIELWREAPAVPNWQQIGGKWSDRVCPPWDECPCPIHR